ncbi:MAG: hypothetical protein ACJ746_16950 [Bryobacteraceae bacterium]
MNKPVVFVTFTASPPTTHIYEPGRAPVLVMSVKWPDARKCDSEVRRSRGKMQLVTIFDARGSRPRGLISFIHPIRTPKNGVPLRNMRDLLSRYLLGISQTSFRVRARLRRVEPEDL